MNIQLKRAGERPWPSINVDMFFHLEQYVDPSTNYGRKAKCAGGQPQQVDKD